MGWLRDIAIAVIDTETTGLAWNRDGIAELAVVLIDDGIVSGEHVWLLNPGIPFTVEATAAHGLTDQDVVAAPRFADVVIEVAEVLAGRTPAAYNAPFDRSFVQRHVEQVGARAFDVTPAFQYGVDWIDVLVWARRLCQGIPNRKLATVAAHLGVPTVNQHRALADAKRAAEILIRLADRMPVDFHEMLAVQHAAYAEQRASFGRRDW